MSRQSRINWSSNTLIKLNVGGHAYEEKARTLRKLKDLIDNEINESHPNFDPQTDCVFLSGDGDMFKFVMHYLRRGTVKLPADFKDHELLCEEAESYGLHDLAELVKRGEKNKNFLKLGYLILTTSIRTFIWLTTNQIKKRF